MFWQVWLVICKLKGARTEESVRSWYLGIFTPSRQIACLYYKHSVRRTRAVIAFLTSPLLSLICDFDVLASIQLHTSCTLLGTDCPGLVLVLHERNSSSSRHQTYFAEALETAKDVGKSLDIAVVGKVLDEKNLVRGEILVRYHSGGRRASGLEASASCCLRRTSRLVATWSGALEALLFSFQSLLLVCE